ncbi:MAG: Dyp-type peroxidase, partial [Solirubrobacteraceae bacterium]
APDPAATLPPVAFEGLHQAGIVTAPTPAATFAALDVSVRGQPALADLLRTMTEVARRLTSGTVPPQAAPGAPAADSGTLGPAPPADGLTLTLAVGTALFDARFGLSQRRPAGLFEMRAFPNDRLDPAWCAGDLMLSVSAGSADTVVHALRELLRDLRGSVRIRWRIDGFVSPPRPAGVPRNHHGFHDGIANPDVARPGVAGALVWVSGARGAQAWTNGGTYQVTRLIRMFTESWDQLPVAAQERIIGRDRASGAPLGARRETDPPDYRTDPHGRRIPLDAHIRLANPRTAQTERSRILRRSYSYDRGVDHEGRLDLGLVFNCYQRDVRRQFEAVQARLRHEPMAPFIEPFGGGYFFVLPGIRDRGDWYGRGMLGA